MKLIASIFALSAVLIFALLIAIPAVAQDGELDLLSQVDYQFGSQIAYRGSLDTLDEITRAVVFMRPEGGGETLVLEASFQKEETASYRLEAILDVRSSPIRPFELWTYWWQVEFVNAPPASSPSQKFRYEDNRFQWKSDSHDQIEIYWTEGGDERGSTLMQLTQDSLETLRRSLGLAPQGNLAIFVYPSSADLQSGLRIGGGAPWVGAHTVPELGVVLLAANNTPEAVISIERDLPHELTHLLLYQRMGDNYSGLPAWLSEGLATLQEKQANPAYRFELERAVESNALLTIESLCSAFPMAESDALLAYAQSASFTRYLLDVYGMGGILQLLDAYQEGTSCTGGVQRVYQRPLTQLESEWKNVHLQSPTTWQRLIPILPWGLLILPIILLVLIGLSARRKRNPA